MKHHRIHQNIYYETGTVAGLRYKTHKHMKDNEMYHTSIMYQGYHLWHANTSNIMKTHGIASAAQNAIKHHGKILNWSLDTVTA